MKVTCPPRTIALELTEEEATVLCALTGGVLWNIDSPAGRIVHELWSSLDKLLPNRTQAFSDLFENNPIPLAEDE